MTTDSSPLRGRAGNRVLLVLGSSTGGIGVHVESLVRGLASRGWQVQVLTTAQTAAHFDLGADVSTMWPQRVSRSPGALLSLRRAAHHLAAGADVVHAHGHQAGLVALTASASHQASRPQTVLSWHNATIGVSGKRALVERWQARHADLVTGASQDLVDRARSLGARQAMLAPVAAPLAGAWQGSRAQARQRLVDELGLDPALPLVLTVSRLAAQKNLPMLVEASARLATDVPHQWLIVGDGDVGLTARVLSRIRETAAPMRLVGHRSDVPALMAAADAFVLASAWEARALVVQEALGAGLPVVAPDVGGLHDLLDGLEGLVQPGDLDDLVDSVGLLLRDGQVALARGQAGRDRFASLPTESDVITLWDQTYRRMLARTEPRS